MARIHTQCVSSEQIKLDSGADILYGYMQIGYGIELGKFHKFKPTEIIGYIDYLSYYLGDDYIIKSIKIHGNKQESDRLTRKYGGKILITSELGDKSCS